MSAQSRRDATLIVPGKIFLMGEYSVIDGGEALLALVRPGYMFSRVSGSKTAFHPDSPAGRFLSNQGGSVCSIESDGSAGFGSSTAELIAAACFAENKVPDTKELWHWYRERFPEASGADLVAQIEGVKGRHSLYMYSNGEAVPVRRSGLFTKIHAWKAPAEQKLPTHEDLKRIRMPLDQARANAFVEKFKEVLESDRESELGILSEWAEWLHQSGLESTFATRVRNAFESVDGVAGVKGCGAGLNDVILTALSDERAFPETERVAENFGLIHLGKLSEILWWEGHA